MSEEKDSCLSLEVSVQRITFWAVGCTLWNARNSVNKQLKSTSVIYLWLKMDSTRPWSTGRGSLGCCLEWTVVLLKTTLDRLLAIVSLLEHSPLRQKKKVTGELNFHSPTNPVQRSAPCSEASACSLAPDARSALCGRDGLGSMPGKGRLCECHEGHILFRESPGLGRVRSGQEAQHLIRHAAHTNSSSEVF